MTAWPRRRCATARSWRATRRGPPRAQAERDLAAARAALESAEEALAEMSLEGNPADAELKAAQVEWSGTRLACDYLDERYGDADGESASGGAASAKGS